MARWRAAPSARSARGAGATGTVGAFDYLLSAQSASTRGFNAIAPRLPNTGERDGFRGVFTTARLGWTPVEGTRIEGLLRWRQTNFGLDDVPRDDPNYSAEDRRWYGQLRGETRLFDGIWTTGLRLAATEDRRRYVNLPDALSPATADDLFVGTRTTLDWGNTVRLPALGALTDGALGFGVTHGFEESRSASGSPFFRTTVDANQHTTAGYATLQYRLLERLDMTAGLRHDATTGFTDETTWRLGAVLALPEIASRLRASGGTAFAAPSLFQRFGVIGSFFRGNPDLRPERSIGWEVGAETDFPAFGRAAFATTSVTYFQSRIRDLINFDAGFRTLTNIDRARIQGVELGLTLRPAAWFETTAAWTITGAFDDATGRRLPRRPEHVVSVTARIAPVPRVVIAPTLLFTGRSPEGAFASYSNEGVAFPYPRSNPAGTVVNVTGDVAGLRAGGAVPGSAQPRQQPLRAGERLRHAGQERAGRHALRVVRRNGAGGGGRFSMRSPSPRCPGRPAGRPGACRRARPSRLSLARRTAASG